MVGNSWVYRATRARVPDMQTASVTGTTQVNNVAYYTVRFFNRDLLLRTDDKGVILQYDPDSKSEKIWLDATGGEGSTFPTNLDSCTKSGKIQSIDTKFKGPSGDFANALKLTFTPSCADAGWTDALLVPYVGFVQLSQTTIAGPRVYDLVYSRTGVTELADKQVSFSLALDQLVYTPGSTLVARLTLRSSLPDSINLLFPSGQDGDLAIRNDKGEVVYRWSADKLFPQIVRNEKFGPGEKNVVLSAPLSNIPAGKYTVEAYLTTEPKIYVASVSFELRGPQ